MHKVQIRFGIKHENAFPPELHSWQFLYFAYPYILLQPSATQGLGFDISGLARFTAIYGRNDNTILPLR